MARDPNETPGKSLARRSTALRKKRAAKARAALYQLHDERLAHLEEGERLRRRIRDEVTLAVDLFEVLTVAEVARILGLERSVVYRTYLSKSPFRGKI